MSKLYDFLEKAAADDASSARINSILGGSKFGEATDEQIGEICEVAKKLGFDVAPDDIREGIVRELSEDELDDVVGGARPSTLRGAPRLERVYKPCADYRISGESQYKRVDMGDGHIIEIFS